MGTNITRRLALRFGGNSLAIANRTIVAIGVVSSLVIAGSFVVVTGAGATFAPGDMISVDRTHKGDRLSPLPKPTSKASSSVVTSLARPPVGCESAFSRAADPARAHIFGRCVS
jgi:hypothetical protein